MEGLFTINYTKYWQENAHNHNDTADPQIEAFSLIGCIYPRWSTSVDISKANDTNREGAVDKRDWEGINTIKDAIW